MRTLSVKMKAKIEWSRIVVLLWLIVGAEFSSVKAEGPSRVRHVDDRLNSILSTGGTQFSFNLYGRMKDRENLFFSPFSVRVALAMAAAGTASSTLTVMNRALQLYGFQNEDESNLAFQSYLNSFCPNPNFTLTTANRIYAQNGFPIRKSYIETLEKYFLSGAENVDFSFDPEGAAERINRWVEERTNGIIRNVVSAQTLPGNIVMLVSAIYFKGRWKDGFDPTDTKPGTFRLADGGTIQVPTMYTHRFLPYTFSTALNSQVVRLDYVGDRLAMYIILPEQLMGLLSIREKLNSEIMNDCIAKTSSSEKLVDLYLPKFKAEYSDELSHPLKSLGAHWDTMSRMSSDPIVRLTSVMHKAYMAVDEEGAGVTAGVAGGISAAGRPPTIIFRVDRPCFYLIYDREFKQILFMGNLDEPKY